MKFRIITKNSVHPQGRKKVFLCTDGNDLEKYTQILEMLWKYQDCAVYYVDHADVPWNEQSLESILSQMQLIVVPVTERVLFGNGPARTAAAYASKRHFPILPLLLEDHLEPKFNEVFHSMQALRFSERNTKDFHDTVNSYLDAISISPQIHTMIRKSLAAHIFISYRKVNRRQRDQVIEIIRQDPFFWDVGVWYDDFLIPGENFDDTIAESIENCDLVVMVMTPEMLLPAVDGRPNYVITREYRLAVERKKKIFPILMDETMDQQMIQRAFPGIPYMRTLENIPKLLDDMKHQMFVFLNNPEIKLPEHRPETTYIMGLAYLYGIDMEINTDKGIELIGRAAQRGLPDACKTLSGFYQSGIYVEKDPARADFWMKEFFSFALGKFQQNPSLPLAELLAEECLTYGDHLSSNGRNQEALEYYSYVRYLYDNVLKDTAPSGILMLHLVHALTSAAVIWKRDGNLEAAFKNQNMAVQLLQYLEGQPALSADLRERISGEYRSALDSLAKICWKAKQYEEALKIYRDCENLILREMQNSGETAGLCNDLAGVYSSCGNIYASMGKSAPAQENQKQCRMILRKLYQNLNTVPDSLHRQLKLNLVYANNDLAELYFKVPYLTGAYQSLKEAHDIGAELCSVYKDGETYGAFTQTYRLLAQLAQMIPETIPEQKEILGRLYWTQKNFPELFVR